MFWIKEQWRSATCDPRTKGIMRLLLAKKSVKKNWQSEHFWENDIKFSEKFFFFKLRNHGTPPDRNAPGCARVICSRAARACRIYIVTSTVSLIYIVNETTKYSRAQNWRWDFLPGVGKVMTGPINTGVENQSICNNQWTKLILWFIGLRLVGESFPYVW